MPIYKKISGLDFPYFMDVDIREIVPKLINNSNQLKKKIYLLKAFKKFYQKKLNKKIEELDFIKVFWRRSKKIFLIKKKRF